MKKIFICIIILLLIGCSNRYNNLLNPSITKLKSTIEVITTEVDVKTPNEKYKERWITHATSFHIGNGYILALTHATKHPGHFIININNKNLLKIDLIIGEYSFFINDKPIELIGRFEDISIFKTNHTNIVIPFGDSDKLELGTEIIIIGNSLMNGINIKRGIVSILDLSDGYKLDKEKPNDNYKESFIIDSSTIPGDSGSPVVALKNNQYYLVGVVYASFDKTRSIGMCFDINYIKQVIKRLIKNDNQNSEL